ncbi:DUF1707 domain-containing protein [Streptomyces sp. NPDC006879]|uniref:DUF1707 SHOCT-like domain-containing protein n=1 Tax=Streptomyces sp. NPDC006879 TaxID=3364767 RepID=UPI0036C37A00
MDLEKHPPTAGIRASDADRDRIAHLLADAFAQGRLTAEEHGERLEVLHHSKTMGQLEALVGDLPDRSGAPDGVQAPEVSRAPAAPAGPTLPRGESVLAVCGSAARKGRWRPGARTRVVAVLGDVTIDLTEALFEQQVIEINALSVLGNVEVLVPENVTVRGYGSGVLGAFEVTERESADAAAPVVLLRGHSVLGHVEARSKSGSVLVDLAGPQGKREAG